MLVVSHGVSDALHDATYDMMRCFFSLSTEHKRLIDKRTSRHFRGWEPVGSEYTNNRPDIREQIDCWTEWPALAPDTEPEYLRLLGPNQWLPDDLLAGPRGAEQRVVLAAGRTLAGRLLGCTVARSRAVRRASRALHRFPAHVAHQVHPLSRHAASARPG